MIEEARAQAKAAQYKAEQELLVTRMARAMRNARTAQAVHDNFRRFGAFLPPPFFTNAPLFPARSHMFFSPPNTHLFPQTPTRTT